MHIKAWGNIIQAAPGALTDTPLWGHKIEADSGLQFAEAKAASAKIATTAMTARSSINVNAPQRTLCTLIGHQANPIVSPPSKNCEKA